MNQKINIPKIHVNAEFQRLLWLNRSWGVMIGVILLYAVFAASRSDYLNQAEYAAYLALIGMGGITLSLTSLYVLIQRSLKRDVDANFFDQLRMSSLSAWQMTYSRILVAPMAAWLVWIIGWLMFLPSLWYGSQTAISDMMGEAVLTWLSMPFLIWTYACLILANAMQFKRGNNQWEGSLQQLVLLNIIIFLFMIGGGEALWANQLQDLPSSLLFFISSALSAVLAGFAAHGAMAHRLHLAPARPVFLIVGLLSPVVNMALMNGIQSLLQSMFVFYGIVSLVSLATQDNSPQGLKMAKHHYGQGDIFKAFLNLPAWMVLMPLGALAALFISPSLIKVYLQIVIFMGLVLLFTAGKPRHNAVTVAMVVYLLLRMLWFSIMISS